MVRVANGRVLLRGASHRGKVVVFDANASLVLRVVDLALVSAPACVTVAAGERGGDVVLVGGDEGAEWIEIPAGGGVRVRQGTDGRTDRRFGFGGGDGDARGGAIGDVERGRTRRVCRRGKLRVRVPRPETKRAVSGTRDDGGSEGA